MATVTSVQVTYNGRNIATGDTISAAVGETITVYATALTDAGTDSAGVNWYPIGDGSFFTWGTKTTSSAQITITAAGSQSVYVRAANANSVHVRFVLTGTEGGSATETVSSVTTDVASSLSMTVGQSITVNAYANPSTLSDRTVSFVVSGTNYLSITSSSNYSCTIRAIAAGTAYLVCSSNLDSSVYTIITVTISAAATESVSYVSANISSPYAMTVGDSVSVTAYAYPSSLSDRTVTFSIYSGSSYASITSSSSYQCTVSARAAGTAYLRIYSDLDSSVYTTIQLNISASSSSGDPSYTVMTASGASYGFSKTSDGYWTSQNAGVANSAAVALVIISTPGNYNVYVDCINYGESNFDYGILSNTNYVLDTTNADDGATGTSVVKKNFKGLQSASVQTVDYGVLSAGTYNIYAKYRKDSSVDNNNDSLKFVVRFESVAAQETVEYVGTSIASPYAMTVGDTVTVSAYAFPTTLSDRTVTFATSGSGITLTSSTSNSGTISATAAGTAYLYAFSSLDNSVYAVITINISAVAETVSSVSINLGSSYAMTVGDSVSVTAYAYPTSLSDRTVTFSISQSGTVISKSGTTDNGCTISAVAAGTATLYAFSDLDDSVYAACTITVNAAPSGTKVREITISCDSYELSVNSFLALNLTVSPSDAADTSVTWASSDTNIATVTSAGYIIGTHRGRVTITATANDGSGVVATAIFIVRPAAYIYNDGWKKATAFIRSGSWAFCLPDIYPYVTGTTGFQGCTGGTGGGDDTSQGYTVATASGASYSFELTSDGYYTSTNAGVAYSAAVSVVTITTPGGLNVYFDCISYGESNYDYGIISNVGQTLGTTYSDDGTTGTTVVKHNFKGESSASVQTIDYGSLAAGTYTVYVKYRKDQNTDNYNDSFKFAVRLEKATPTYSVATASGASYGFTLESDGYYTSANAAVANSAAVCVVTVNTPGGYNLYVDCINYAESTYDYGLLSNLGQTLSTTNSADDATGSTKVKKNFSGSQSASVQTVDYGVLAAGTYTFYAKFLKDNSVNKNNDSLKFTLRFE